MLMVEACCGSANGFDVDFILNFSCDLRTCCLHHCIRGIEVEPINLME